MLLPCGSALLFTSVAFFTCALSGMNSLSSLAPDRCNISKFVNCGEDAFVGGSTMDQTSATICSTGTHFANKKSHQYQTCTMHWPPWCFYLRSNHFFACLSVAGSACSKAAHFYWFVFSTSAQFWSLVQTIMSNPMTANCFYCHKQNFSCARVQNVSLFCPTPLIGSIVTWTIAIAIK